MQFFLPVLGLASFHPISYWQPQMTTGCWALHRLRSNKSVAGGLALPLHRRSEPKPRTLYENPKVYGTPKIISYERLCHPPGWAADTLRFPDTRVGSATRLHMLSPSNRARMPPYRVS
jgi:hypothetical protein